MTDENGKKKPCRLLNHGVKYNEGMNCYGEKYSWLESKFQRQIKEVKKHFKIIACHVIYECEIMDALVDRESAIFKFYGGTKSDTFPKKLPQRMIMREAVRGEIAIFYTK